MCLFVLQNTPFFRLKCPTSCPHGSSICKIKLMSYCGGEIQVLIYRDRPKSATIYKYFKLSRRSCRFSECSEDSKKCRVRLMKQVEALLPIKTGLTILVVLLDILLCISFHGNH